MDFIHFIMLTLLITQVITKSRNKKYSLTESSDETIENLLYYKDCQKKPKEETTTAENKPLRARAPPPPPPPPPQPDCPFPKMCCALSCGNECGAVQRQNSFMSRPVDPIQSFQDMPLIQPMNSRLSIPPVQPQMRKRKKIKPQMDVKVPIGGRRSFGFSKDKIKSLITQDDDIRKILKDLVRVTMQKADLMDMMNGSQKSTQDPNVDMNADFDYPSTPEAIYEDYD